MNATRDRNHTIISTGYVGEMQGDEGTVEPQVKWDTWEFCVWDGLAMAQLQVEERNEDCNEEQQHSKRRLLAEEIIEFIVCLYICVSNC